MFIVDNPTYGESIDMTMGPSAEKKPSLNLYESPCDGKAHKNQVSTIYTYTYTYKYTYTYTYTYTITYT